jgi:Calcineurin-like phosphoesterase
MLFLLRVRSVSFMRRCVMAGFWSRIALTSKRRSAWVVGCLLQRLPRALLSRMADDLWVESAMADSMRVLVAGDTHGNSAWMHNMVIPYAVSVGATKIMQVGDFGFIWPSPNFSRTLTKLNTALDRVGIDLHFLPGNHEDFDRLDLISARTHGVSPEGHLPFRKRIFYTGKVSAWTWAGRRCVAVGGATSIDRMGRVAGKSWWPQEALTAAEAAQAKAFGRTDVLFAHDCPTQHPFRIIPNADSLTHRQRVTDVARVLEPSAWFHGHYHQYAKYEFRHGGGLCAVTGLDCDESPHSASLAVLDLSSPR